MIAMILKGILFITLCGGVIYIVLKIKVVMTQSTSADAVFLNIFKQVCDGTITKEEAQEILRKAGFKDVDIGTF